MKTKKNIFIFYFFSIFIFSATIAQPLKDKASPFNPLSKPNTYRNSDNPYYWKNRLPYPGYWQQDVYYNIKAELDDRTDIISGTQKLTYWNNSPDNLEYVYFYLYQNAFQPGSYYDNLQKNNGSQPKYGKYESLKLGIVIESIVAGGVELGREIDNTILKVYLEEPLKSGESITFDIKFQTYFDKEGSLRRRMKLFNAFGNKHYDGVLWYPRICVYDSKFGWSTDQHLGHEFYGDFGTYDVDLTLPHHYILDATGFMVNKEEVLPKELREKLDIKNFKDKEWNSSPSVIIPPDSTQFKTWIFHAENVHDFAFTADPTYRIGEAEWNGIKCISLAQEPHASKWQNAASYAAKVIKVYSEDFGMYGYHKMIVADARDGMEYPMLTLDSGQDPGYRGLFAHEIGHNWFYGMVGNNETYRAALDEGFTQFLTVWSMDKIDGPYAVRDEVNSNYYNKYYLQQNNKDSKIYSRYIADAMKGNDPQLNTHSDDFNGKTGHDGGYGQVYYKTATMLYNLQYVLGKEVFLDAMKNYFNQWKFCHPYFEDFRKSITGFAKTNDMRIDLNWFFDQWLETTKSIDYAIKSVKKLKSPKTDPNDTTFIEPEYEYQITFERKGKMHMPIDFEIFSKDEHACERYMYHIPNTDVVKYTNAQILPKWYGWDKINPTYQVKITLPSEIDDIVIDPTYRLADVNMLNNSKNFPVYLNFDSKVKNPLDWTVYRLNVRPDLWYNSFDGLKAGVHFNGNYLNYKHIFDANMWFSTQIGQGDVEEDQIGQFRSVSYRLHYLTGIDKFSKNSNFLFKGKFLDGLHSYTIGLNKRDADENNEVYINIKSMYRPDSTDLNYLLYPDEWGIEKFNNSINLGYIHKYNYNFGNGNIHLGLRSSTLATDYDYNVLHLTVLNKNKCGKFDINTRTFVQYVSGTNGASESALFLAGANPEELSDNKFTSAAGIIPEAWAGYGVTTNHFHHSGGLNLRGYSGYLVNQLIDDENSRLNYKGSTGASININFEFDRLFKKEIAYNPREHEARTKPFDYDLYIFTDAGIINYNYSDEPLAFGDVRADAGIGGVITLQRIGYIEDINPFSLRFDIPLYLSHMPAEDEGTGFSKINSSFQDNFKFRWIIGVTKAF